MRRPLLALVFLAGCAALPLPHETTYHSSDADLTAVRIAHGSLVLELAGTRLLVDPWFHSSFFARQIEPLGLTPEHLPDAAAVLITHRHGDHFDRDALREIAKKVPRAIAPSPLAETLHGLGFREVTPLEWWDATDVGPLHVTAVPASHPVRENGYVVASDRARAYLAGDTRYFASMVDIATAFPHLDVAFLPIGGERLLGFWEEMGPAAAAKAAALLKPRRVVPIGYGERGGFPFVWYSRKPVEHFVAAAAAEDYPAEHIVVLEPGESWHYYR